MIILVILFAVLIVAVVATSVRIVPLYERVVVFRRGRAVDTRGPGPVLLIPVLESARSVDMRVDVMHIPPQAGVARDAASVQLGVVLFYHVVDPQRAATEVSDYRGAVLQITQRLLGRAIAESDARSWLSQQKTSMRRLEGAIQRHCSPCGVEVTSVRLLDLKVPAYGSREAIPHLPSPSVVTFFETARYANGR